MKVFHSMDTDFLAGGAIAIGNFDGVHLGHQALIKKARALCPKSSGVLSFYPHPKEIFNPKTPHFYLASQAQKLALFESLGLDAVIIQKTTQEFLDKSPEQFVKDLAKLKIKHVVVGEDFSFGQKALGNCDLLKTLGQGLGIATHIIDKVLVNKIACSSTLIRKFLKAGDVKAASSFLGRFFSLKDVVIAGQKKARGLGFPTANLSPKNFFLRPGVYSTVTKINDQFNLSITNVGFRPTLTCDENITVETHILTGSHELYGQDIEVFFIDFLRDEKKFSSISALQEQVQIDCQKARQNESILEAFAQG